VRLSQYDVLGHVVTSVMRIKLRRESAGRNKSEDMDSHYETVSPSVHSYLGHLHSNSEWKAIVYLYTQQPSPHVRCDYTPLRSHPAQAFASHSSLLSAFLSALGSGRVRPMFAARRCACYIVQLAFAFYTLYHVLSIGTHIDDDYSNVITLLADSFAIREYGMTANIKRKTHDHIACVTVREYP
jgi:hypothetical protein